MAKHSAQGLKLPCVHGAGSQGMHPPPASQFPEPCSLSPVLRGLLEVFSLLFYFFARCVEAYWHHLAAFHRFKLHSPLVKNGIAQK